ncbi:Thioredoxin domain-containing protein 3 [Apodemus speciosus]|uniref:Thioredoxin domain-containing protein 3 n=1 Tax=Apodemus speciosus TaxID=105296 RepID=A0ABQ0FFD7_APOSI
MAQLCVHYISRRRHRGYSGRKSTHSDTEEEPDTSLKSSHVRFKFMMIKKKRDRDDVLDVIQNEGFTILMQRQMILSEEEARTVCKIYENEEYFDNLIGHMSRENGVEYWKTLIGPKTIEEAYASHPQSFASGNFPINQFYGSSSKAAAEKEIEHFFPPQRTLALIKPHVTHEERMEILKAIKEARFELTLMKEMHLTPEHAGKVYFKITGKDFYKNVLEVLSSKLKEEIEEVFINIKSRGTTFYEE